MLQPYTVQIHLEDGTAHTGHSAQLDPDGRTLRFSPRPDAPPTASVALNEVRLARFEPLPGLPTPLSVLPSGAAVQLTFPDGRVLESRTAPIPLPGGLWIRVNGDREDALMLIPHGAAPKAEFSRAAAGVAVPVAVANPAGDQRIAANPFEAATINEIPALDPSMMKPGGGS